MYSIYLLSAVRRFENTGDIRGFRDFSKSMSKSSGSVGYDLFENLENRNKAFQASAHTRHGQSCRSVVNTDSP